MAPQAACCRTRRCVTTRIGSGSDHTVFINHVGLPVVEMQFDGPYGVYHSAYDSHHWLSTIGDPGFSYHHADDAALGHDGAAARQRRHPAATTWSRMRRRMRDFVRALDDIPELRGAPRHVPARGRGAAAARVGPAAERIEWSSALAAGALPPRRGRRASTASCWQFERTWLHDDGHSRAAVVQAPALRAALHLRGDDPAGHHRGGRGEELDARAGAARSARGRRSTRNIALVDRAAALLPDPPAGERRVARGAAARGARHGGRPHGHLRASTWAPARRVAIDADTPYETFSVIKVPIMATVLQRVREGTLSLSDRVTLRADQRRIPVGRALRARPRPAAHRARPAHADDDHQRQRSHRRARRPGGPRRGHRRTWPGSGCRTPASASRISTGIGCGCRPLDPSYRDASGDKTVGFPFAKYSDAAVSEAFRRVIEDTGLYFGRSTARETGRLFALMAKGELVSKDASALMIVILKRQQVNNRIPRYLGGDVEVAHKTGDGQPWVANDAGILWIKGQPIVLVVFAGHHRGTTEALHDAEAPHRRHRGAPLRRVGHPASGARAEVAERPPALTPGPATGATCPARQRGPLPPARRSGAVPRDRRPGRRARALRVVGRQCRPDRSRTARRPP